MCRRRCSTTLKPKGSQRSTAQGPWSHTSSSAMDIPSRAAGADCQEIGRELVTCHQRGWKSTKPGVVTIQSDAGATF